MSSIEKHSLDTTTNNEAGSERERMSLSEVIELYDTGLRPALDEYLLRVDTEPAEDESRQLVTNCVSAIDRLLECCTENAAAVGSVNAYNHLLGPLQSLRRQFGDAPDTTYSTEALASSHGGAEQVPAGTPTYEQTRDAVIRVRGVFEGITIAQQL
jgi:hypothetical protein